jgi:hypothetical protein
MYHLHSTTLTTGHAHLNHFSTRQPRVDTQLCVWGTRHPIVWGIHAQLDPYMDRSTYDWIHSMSWGRPSSPATRSAQGTRAFGHHTCHETPGRCLPAYELLKRRGCRRMAKVALEWGSNEQDMLCCRRPGAELTIVGGRARCWRAAPTTAVHWARKCSCAATGGRACRWRAPCNHCSLGLRVLCACASAYRDSSAPVVCVEE